MVGLAQPLSAATDGSSNLICSVIDVVGCADNGACLEGSSRDFNLPGLLVIDFGKKQVRAHSDAGIDAVSPIKNQEKTEQQLILQGVENHRGWTLSVDRLDGSLALSSSGSDINMMVFGTCAKI